MTAVVAWVSHTGITVSWPVFWALLPLVLAGLAVDAYALVDLARVPSVKHLSKPWWAVVILVVSAPLGALVYLFLGRGDALHEHLTR